jgi:putative aldouronate transport system substrate-binding protein
MDRPNHTHRDLRGTPRASFLPAAGNFVRTAPISRRGFLRLSAGTGVLLGLAACTAIPSSQSGTSAPATTKSSAAKPLTLPTYQPPANMPTPDLPGSADGVVAPGWVNWPKTNFKSVKQAPGDGSEVSIFIDIPGAPPPPLDQNPAWQAWNQALNVKLTFQLYAFADLAPKFGTLIAGNDLPDIVKTLVRQDIPLTPELFAAKAADLTPYVSGDAIKEYPNLAALPTRSWKGMIFDNKIYGVPVPTAQGQFFWWPRCPRRCR